MHAQPSLAALEELQITMELDWAEHSCLGWSMDQTHEGNMFFQPDSHTGGQPDGIGFGVVDEVDVDLLGIGSQFDGWMSPFISAIADALTSRTSRWRASRSGAPDFQLSGATLSRLYFHGRRNVFQACSLSCISRLTTIPCFDGLGSDEAEFKGRFPLSANLQEFGPWADTQGSTVRVGSTRKQFSSYRGVDRAWEKKANFSDLL
jgi:hypothetical protein